MKHSTPCMYDGCGQSKNGFRHTGVNADHDYLGEAKPSFGKQRSVINSRSSQPNRVQKQQETRDAMREYAEAHPYCEARRFGVEGLCGAQGTPDGILDVQHIIARGMGGGKDHMVFARLCRRHHNFIEEHREFARGVGLNERAPVPDKVVPRGWDARPLFDQDEEED